MTAAQMDDNALADLLGLAVDGCDCGKAHRVPTREVLLQPGSLTQLPVIVERWLPAGTILCIADGNTWIAAGEKAVASVRDSGRQVALFMADSVSKTVHADSESVRALAEALESHCPSGLLAVGSGTINDIAKSAATAFGCPQITVATAASMNGYPSAISALTVDGIKTTRPCSPPVAIVADPEVLATAPAEMTAAGYGDLLSKNASTADWVLGHYLFDDYYCDFAAGVTEDAVERCIAAAHSIRQNSPEGISVLAAALIRSGISMVLAGSSAPASGGEHLISHLWDMSAHWTGRMPALHGRQTGVTTLISLSLYEKLLGLDDDHIRRLCLAETKIDPLDRFEEKISTLFGDLAEAVLPYARQKYLDTHELKSRRKRILNHWPDIRRAISGVIIPAATSRSHLQMAGAAINADDLGISKREVSFAYRNARWIRNRYTVLDLAAELGLIEAWETDIMREV